MRITFKQIEVFVVVAKYENMTLASGALYLTQSACSMALAALETQLGGPLFDRHGKKLILNERGRILFPKASKIIAEIQEIQNLMLGKDGKQVLGNLIIGASTTIGNYVLPTIIGNFASAYPDAKLKLHVTNSDQVIQELLKFNIDIGFIEGVCYSDEIDVLPWRTDQLIIIAHPNHPLSKFDKISKKDLQSAKWILREPGSGTRRKFEEAMGGKLTSFFEFGHTEAIKQAVQTGLGISCVSKITVAEALKKREFIQLKTPFLNLAREFYILIHKEKYRTALLNQFIKQCNKV